MAYLQQNRDWAEGLPVNIIDDILDRLVDLSDFIRFASVCLSWRSAALVDRNHRRKKTKWDDYCTQIPMLMVGSLYYDEHREAELYSVTRQKILNFHLPSPYKTYKNIVGSSFGWLINVDKDPQFPAAGVTLFNPFSASVIRLPHILFDSAFHQFDNLHYIVKATLSKDPASYPDEYVVLIIYGKEGKLACIKPSGPAPRWHIIEGRRGFCDIMYSKSSGLFFGLLGTGKVCSIDITRVGGGLDCFTPSLKIKGRGGDDDLRYIVETPSGDLLQVYRFLSSATSYGTFRTLKIEVFKFLKTCRCWSELKNLGDNALFVGDGSSMCVSASGFRGCRPGSVYYSLPYRKYSLIAHLKCSGVILTGKPFDQDWLHYDLGVVDINTQHVESFKLKYPTNRFSMMDATLEKPPVWVVPTFQDLPRKAEDIVPTFLKRPRKEKDIKRPRREEHIVPTFA